MWYVGRPRTRRRSLVIPLQRSGAGLGLRDEVLDDRRGDVVAVQRGLEHRRVAACLRMEPVPLKDAVVQRRVRVGVSPGRSGETPGTRPRDRPGCGLSQAARGTGRRSALPRRRSEARSSVASGPRWTATHTRRRAPTRIGSRATAGARPCRRARVPAGGRDPPTRIGRPASSALASSHCRTVASGMASNSGSNQADACAAFANRIWTCWRFALISLSRWSSSYRSEAKYQTR